jgi:hypothetical protein
MSATLLADLTDQIQKFWAPIFMDELRESAVLPTLLNKEYEGEMQKKGDTVYVTLIRDAVGETKTIGSGHQTFASEKMLEERVAIVANKIFSASFDLDDLISLQTQLGSPEGESAIREALIAGVHKQINAFCYSLVAPSTSAPDHSVASVTDYNAARARSNRLLAAQARWGKTKPWYGLLDPSFYTDALADSTLANKDYGAEDAPVIGGQIALPRYGVNYLEDNTDGILTLSPALAGADVGLIFHPDFAALVLQRQPQFKLSDKHVLGERGYKLSVDAVGGGGLLPDGAKKHILNYAT